MLDYEEVKRRFISCCGYINFLKNAWCVRHSYTTHWLLRLGSPQRITALCSLHIAQHSTHSIYIYKLTTSPLIYLFCYFLFFVVVVYTCVKLLLKRTRERKRENKMLKWTDRFYSTDRISCIRSVINALLLFGCCNETDINSSHK